MNRNYHRIALAQTSRIVDLERRVAELEESLSIVRGYVDQKDKRIAELEAALKQYADPENWGYYDESGCPKGYGSYTEACFIGPEVARKALEGSDE